MRMMVMVHLHGNILWLMVMTIMVMMVRDHNHIRSVHLHNNILVMMMVNDDYSIPSLNVPYM